jgi:hypothetical protein
VGIAGAAAASSMIAQTRLRRLVTEVSSTMHARYVLI